MAGIKKNRSGGLYTDSAGNNYLVPFVLITSLFFLWGFAHGLLDVLNKHFQLVLSVSRFQSGFVQFSVYGAYALMAIPAGVFMRRYGYRLGIVLGLLLYAFGAFLFIPAIEIAEFWAFLVALFIIACGLTALETAANPYVTVLGADSSAAQRINLAQSFNGLGWIVGPLAGSLLIFDSDDANKFSALAIPYVGIGVVVLLIAFAFMRVKLPEIEEESKEVCSSGTVQRSLWKHKHFVWAIVAQFSYVGAQTGINSFFINYVTETMPTISDTKAGVLLSVGGMGLFMVGRFFGSWLLGYVKPNRLLAVFAFINVVLMSVVIANLAWVSVAALFGTYFFMSVMFPTIFALGIKGLGKQTKQASSFLIMSIVGGALCPMVMGRIADVYSIQIGFGIPLLCFAVIFYYGLTAYKLRGIAY
ncbi:MAG: L-fucose:H+ symporter permease [Bacteroidota bacterium]|jgi:FHS family L-fucose permease-like MFS transporter